MFKVVALCSVLVMGAACGGDDSPSTVCGTGTTLVDGACVADPGVQCGSGTTLQNGECVPASTTTCGPGTTLENNVCVVDRTAPAPVTGLTATATGSTVNLSWTAGQSSTGTLVVRTISGEYDAPVPGVVYMVGMTLPGGSTVVSVGNATSATDTATTPGRYSYLAWSQNASGNYGFAREASALATIPAQNAVLTIDVAALTANVTTQPPHIALAASSVGYDAANQILSFDLAAMNNTARHLFNVKAIVRSTSTGTLSQEGTDPDGDSFVTLRFAATPKGESGSQTLLLSGVAADATVTVNVEIDESGLGIQGENIIDQFGGRAIQLEIPELAGSQQDPKVHSGFPSASGRYFYVSTRWHAGLFRVDTATGDVAYASAFLTGSTSCAMIGSDGFAYIAVQRGTHRYRNGNGLGLAKIDPVSMTVIATSEYIGGNGNTGRGCAMNGTVFAATYEEFVVFANTSDLAIIDVDPTTADVVDLVDTGAADTVRDLDFSPNGQTLYASTDNNDANIYAINMADYESSVYLATTGTRVMGLTVAANGTLWWASPTGLKSYDGTTETTVPQGESLSGILALLPGNKALVSSYTQSSTLIVDTTTGDQSCESIDYSSNRAGHRGVFFPTP